MSKVLVRNPLKKALSVWSCECGNEKRLDFKQVSEVGVPFCACLDNHEMELIGLIINGHQFIKIT